MSLHKTLVLSVLLAVLPSLAASQEPVVDPQASFQLQILDLLSWECGSAERANQFELAIEALVADSTVSLEPLLLEILVGGAPREIRRAAEDGASRKFDRRQAWLSENGQELFGDEAKELAERDRQTSVEDSLRRLDVRFRGNAVRALGAVGGYDAIAAIRAAAEKDPDLRLLAETAIERIERRAGDGGGD